MEIYHTESEQYQASPMTDDDLAHYYAENMDELKAIREEAEIRGRYAADYALESLSLKNVIYAGQVADLQGEHGQYVPSLVFNDPVFGEYFQFHLNIDPYTRSHPAANFLGLEAEYWLRGWLAVMRETVNFCMRRHIDN